MKNARVISLLLPSAVLLAIFSLGRNVYASDVDDHPSVTPQPIHPVSANSSAAHATAKPGFPLVISPERQRQSGLKTKPLAAFSMHEEFLAYGRVLDIQALLELRSRYHSAQSELAIADAALRVALKNRDRLQLLHRESIIATRELVQAESQLSADQARQEAAARHIREIREEALQSFGGELSKLAVETESRLLQGLLNHSLVLVLIALPVNQPMPEKIKAIGIAPSGEQGKFRQARLIAPAPKTEESTQGETWFFEASSAGLRTGMRLDASIPRSGQTSQGVLIPHAAIVWHEGRPWVFVKTGIARFVRREVEAYRELGEDWFVTGGLTVNEDAVVVGAQMLLSEEQRSGTPHNGEGNDD